MTFDKPRRQPDRQLIDDLDPNFYSEAEDEAIDLAKIRIHDRAGSAE